MNGVVARPIVGLSICSGYGGLELGLKLVLGDDFFCAVHVERDLVAASVLVERMAEGALEQAPVWDDVATFDGTGWRGCVDIVTAGFPCQPFSVAGKRRGVEDERWIWPDIARVIGEVGPEYVFLENVPGLVRHGLGPVLGSLAEMGFDAEWGCFSAAEIGATHKRERVFILAYRDREWESQPEGIDGDQRRRVGYCRSAVATPDGERQQERCATKPAHAQYATAQCQGGVVADASESGSVVGAEAEWGTQSLRAGGIFPPGPDDADGWRAYLDHSPETQPAIRQPSDGTSGRMDELFLLGNGVVPIVAAYAFTVLARRIGWEVLG